MIPSSCAISSKYIQRGLSRDETALFMTVKKGQSPFLTKGLQSAARIICSLKANKFHTCRLRSIFCQVHAPAKNDSILFAACGRQTLRGFWTISTPPVSRGIQGVGVYSSEDSSGTSGASGASAGSAASGASAGSSAWAASRAATMFTYSSSGLWGWSLML